jgi:hypothetical protein
MASQVEKILILAKTYPSPSAQHVETSCVAGINEQGAMRRLYPVPFRLIEEGQKFKKWQWIEVRIEKANKDHRTRKPQALRRHDYLWGRDRHQKQWALAGRMDRQAPCLQSFDEH